MTTAGLDVSTHGSPDRRISGRRLQRIRAYVLGRNPLCVECERQGRVAAAVEVDHIVPLAAGGTYDFENLRGLCVPCHRAQHGARPRIGLDGVPEDGSWK